MKSQRKIFAVRHGQSEWNVLKSLHPSEEERYHPRMWTVDCSITEKGIQQAKESGKEMSEVTSSIDLLLVSPLRRALQTASHLLNSFPYPPLKVEVCREAAEIMVDPCDIGSDPAHLSKEFPDWDFNDLEKHWWFGGKNSSDTLSLMVKREGLETDDYTEQRISILKQMLQEREEKVIVVVCHSDTIWWLTRHEKNGEVFGRRACNGEILDITHFILKGSKD